MTLRHIIPLAFTLAVAAAALTACSDDDLGPSIFDTDPSQDYLDRTLATFPLDTFVKKEYLEPYNVRFVYRLEDKMSDMTKNLTPAKYDKSVDLAVLTKYLWYDVYKQYAGIDFLRVNSPRIIQLAGSKNYNPSLGTEVMGDASSGVKINFYNVNALDFTDTELMNSYFFCTMHHEFAHILDQTNIHPTEFNTLSAGRYDAAGWQNRPDSLSAGSGFVSSYASASYSEDWAETIAQYITRDTLSWQQLLASAQYDWETYELSGYAAYTDSLSRYNNARRKESITINDSTGRLDTTYYYDSYRDSIYYNLRVHGVPAAEVMGYVMKNSNEKWNIFRKFISRDASGLPVPTADWRLQYTNPTGFNGRDIILDKVQYARDYMRANYGISLDDLRHEVQSRTFVIMPDGSYATDAKGRLVNRLTQVQPSGKTLMDELRRQVYQYNSLIQQ